MSGQVLTGFVVLQVLCCSQPVLVAAGTFTGAGALLGSGTLVTAGLVARLVAVAPQRLPSRTPALHRWKPCSRVAVRRWDLHGAVAVGMTNAWSSTPRRDDGGPHSVALLPGVDTQTRTRLVGTSSCAR